jgi:hypothetical protein
VRERGLADAGQVLDEQVAAREQAGEREADHALLAQDDAAGGFGDLLEFGGHGSFPVVMLLVLSCS